MREINDLLSKQSFTENFLSTKKIPETDWVLRTKDSYGPIKIGKKLWIQPSWNKEKTPKGRIKVLLNPGSSFGTGRHPTTRLMLLAIEDFLLKSEANYFLDVGSGSGILTAVSLKLGAKKGIGFDIDPQAVENTRKLLCLNKLSKRSKVICGTLEKKYLHSLTGKIDLIVANIFLDPLQKLFPLFGEILNL
ncbi:MAG: 50S ribosomal protein L11 methyltransferase, partial [Nitrospinota bacterium]|nr:50S ribosomal protein L11 methyltransferase [Nitrospinota bacterium]